MRLRFTQIRAFRSGDHVAIAEIFCRAVHEVASADYTEEQCLAWSGPTPDPDHWQNRCERKQPFVFERDGQIAGFLELDPDGHIDCAYVHPDHARQGVMTSLVRHAVSTAFEMGLPRVYAEASICIRPLLEREGFDVVREQLVTIKGVEIQNFAMELRNSL